MRKKKSGGGRRALTEAELELMRVLWDLGEGTVAEVIGRLPGEKKPAYTTVSTILRILEGKRVVTSRKEGRGHVYVPVLDRESYGKATVRNLVDKVFGGAPTAMVRALLDTEGVSEDDLREIRRLLEEKGG